MLRQSLAQCEKKQQAHFDDAQLADTGNVGASTAVASEKLLCCLADRCAGVRKVYGDYDVRRAQRPYQTEDYCLEAPCRFRRDRFAAPSMCDSRRDSEADAGVAESVCTGCAAAVEPCPPQVPCADRFRRNVISSAGTWIDGYVRQQERHRLLVHGSTRDLVAYKTLALWKQEIDKQVHFQRDNARCSNSAARNASC